MKHGFELHGFFLEPKSAHLEALQLALPQILIILNPVHISNSGQKWIIERQVVSNDPRNWLSSDDCQNMMTNQPIHIIH